MHQSSGSPAPALGTSASSSTLSAGQRKVRLSDRELFRRVQRVAVPNGPVDLTGLSPKRGWKRVRGGLTGAMEVQYRVLRAPTTVAPFLTRQCQVVVGGEIRASVSELLSLLRAPTESESNALLHALYGSQFIYSSLLHAVPNAERGSLASPPARASADGASIGQLLLVRTASFAHTGRFNPFKHRSSTTTAPSDSMTTTDSRDSGHQRQPAKNEQCCYIELVTPTQEGFKVAYCSLDAADVTAGKAPPDRVIPLHPITGWFTAEPSPTDPGTLQITFQAAFPGNAPGSCDSRVAQGRLLSIAKGICRLEKVLRRRRRHHRQQHTAPGRLWQALLNPFRVLGVVASDDGGSGGSHHNWHCIACTRSFLPTLRKSWRRCDLCAYRVCAEPLCCTHERVAIYNRYVAPLLVCARCRECIDERESDNRNAPGSGVGGARYTGVSLHFAGQEGGLQPELELDPSERTHGRWGSIVTPSSPRRSSGGRRRKRRAQSDPPPLLGLAFSSSGDDNSSSGADLAPGARTKHS
ncbi:hypothetical protein PRIC1_004970 [Phytophthora ramorum]